MASNSFVDSRLKQHGLAWMLNPYRIVVHGRPDLVVQTGPSFDLRESALVGARERAIEAYSKNQQLESCQLKIVPQTEQYKPSIGGVNSILGPYNSEMGS